MSQKQADLTVFALDLRCARAPFAPPGYAGDFAHRPLFTVTLNSNFAILKTSFFFSIGVKELLAPIVLERRGDRFLLFFKAFSWETDL